MTENNYLFGYDMVNGMTYVGKKSSRVQKLNTKRQREGSLQLEDVVVLLTESVYAPETPINYIRDQYKRQNEAFKQIPQVVLNLENAIAEYIVP